MNIDHFLATVCEPLTASGMSNITLVLLYAALLVIVTSVLSLRTNDPDPMLAGRNMPWWLIAGSIIGTDISSIAFIGFPEKGYNFDFSFILGDSIGPLLGAPIVMIGLIDFLRRTRDASIYTLLGDRFGKWASTYASIAFIIYALARIGVITCLVAQALHLICGIDTLSVMLLTGAIVIFYTYMSGIEGVMWTDLFQTLILLVAGIWSIVFLIQGFEAITPDWMNGLQDSAKIKGTLHEMSIHPGLMIITCIFWLTESVQAYGTNQGFAQRYIVARSSFDAKLGLGVASIGATVVVWVFFGIGVLLYFYQQLNPEAFASFVPGQTKVFAYFITNHFPDGLKGLAIIGILAAAMSTIDTGINSSSTVLICNLYEPYAKASLMNKALLATQILRKSSLFFGVLGIAVAYSLHHSGVEILGWFWEVVGLSTTGIFGLFLLMRFNPKIGPRAGAISVFAGTMLCAWMTFTAGGKEWWSSPFNVLLTMPLGTLLIVTVGMIFSKLLPEAPKNALDSPQFPSAQAVAQLAQKRKRAKKNIFADSLRPKPFYQLYAGIGFAVVAFMFYQRESLQLSNVDQKLLIVSMVALSFVVLFPFIIQNIYSKFYTSFYVTCLGVGLPFVGSMFLFGHSTDPMYGYFYLLTLGALGTMVGWTILGVVGILATALGAQLSVEMYPMVGVPSQWAMIAIGGLGIFTYFAMEAAKEALVAEQTLSKVHTIVQKIYKKIIQSSVDLMHAKRSMHFKDLDRLAKTAGDVERMVGSLMGATDVAPEEIQMELSVRESLDHVKEKFGEIAQDVLTITGDNDFCILGSRDIFENVLSHILENAFYYVERGLATHVICTLDARHKHLTIANNGPKISPKDSLYIFDLGYSQDKDGLGLGLAYCKRMLESMRGGIRLISKPHQPWVKFRLYFPKYNNLPEEAQYMPIADAE